MEAAVVDAPATSLEAWQASATEVALGVSGGEWRYRESRGAGPTLLLLPGAQGTGDMFYRTALLLGDRYRVITATPPAWADCERIAHGLEAFVDALGLNDLHLLGSSLSGYTVQLYAHEYPSRIRTLFLANTFCDASPFQAQMPSLQVLAETPAEAMLRGMVERMLAAPVNEPVEQELKDAVRALMGPKQSPEELKARVLALRRARPAPVLNLPSERIVIIDDDEDPVIPPAMRAALRERYAGSERHAIAGGGHYPSILRPLVYADILDRRLGSFA